MGDFFLIGFFRLYRGLKLSFKHKSAWKNLFFSTCFYWDSSLFLCEKDLKFKFGGNIGYCDSYLEFTFHFKVFTLHATLYYAAGAVRTYSGKRLGYCYMIGGGPKSCFLSHVTELLFCLYVKHFLPSIFKSVNFWSSISCIVLDIELADISDNRNLAVCLELIVQGYSFRLPNKKKPTKQAVWCTKHFHRNVWNKGPLAYSELHNILPSDVKGEYFAQRTEKCRILGSLVGNEMENLNNHGCTEVQDLVDEEKWICSSYPFRHKTTIHCAECKEKLFGKLIMQHLKL